MTSSRKCNHGKNKERVKARFARKNISKLYSKNKSFFFSPKKENHFEFKKSHPIPFFIDTEKKFVIMLKEGERDIYIESTKCKLNQRYFIKYNEEKCIVKSSDKDKDEKFFSLNESERIKIILKSDQKSERKYKNIIDFCFSKKHYCNYLPSKDEMRENAHKIPSHFPIECHLGINQNHNEIGNKEFLNLKDINIFNSNNDSYKTIDRKDHLLLNHFCQKNIGKKIVNSFTVKYRNKNTTFLYYK